MDVTDGEEGNTPSWRGAQIIEGYPVEPQAQRMAAISAYTGLASTFRQVGFVEVTRRSPSRPIMRYRHSIR